jgi:Holliday junction resolvase
MSRGSGVSPKGIGLYMAYPTTAVLKPIYRKLKTLVNDQHTKVGKTRDSFEKRAREYRNTFNREVEFIPLVEVPLESLDAIEAAVLLEIGRRYPRVGRATEWFDTVDRDAIAELVCRVAAQVQHSPAALPQTEQGLLKSVPPPASQPPGGAHARAKQLGDEGERLVVELLRSRGYAAELLPTNYPTYDVVASRGPSMFHVSVKVSREKQHVRLGSRASVMRLSVGNFVFAFLPDGGPEISLNPPGYRLLIIPAEVAKADSLANHDAYWDERGGDRDAYSVMIKGYERRPAHRAAWERWQEYRDAWHLLP